MARAWRIRRGTTAQNNAFTGVAGEVVADMDKKELRVHDGNKAGGFVIGEKTEHGPDRFLVAASATTLTIKAGVRVAVGTTYFETDSAQTITPASCLDSGSSLANGKDYYVYVATNDNSTVSVVCSLSASAPSGYTSYRRIGGFHTLCVNVGSISGHTLTGFTAGSILPQSVWCLNHYPRCMPINNAAGMVYVQETDSWVDIYNMGTSGQSAYGATRANNLQHYQFAELARQQGKDLIGDQEFFVASQGSNQQTAVNGAAQPSPDTTGGRNDTAGRRMISNYGCEEMCGLQWQHLAGWSAAGGSGWNAQNGGQGQFYGSAMILRAGGAWGDSSYCGSRSRLAANSLSCAFAASGARGRSPAVHTWYA